MQLLASGVREGLTVGDVRILPGRGASHRWDRDLYESKPNLLATEREVPSPAMECALDLRSCVVQLFGVVAVGPGAECGDQGWGAA